MSGRAGGVEEESGAVWLMSGRAGGVEEESRAVWPMLGREELRRSRELFGGCWVGSGQEYRSVFDI